MKQNIDSLIGLADKWNKLSYKINGWETVEYVSNGLKVRCYFADNSDHKSIQFEDKRHTFNKRKFGVDYFSPVHISFDYGVDMEFLIDQTKNLLGVKEKEYEQTTQEEINRRKKEKIKSLKKQLTELEGEQQ